MQQKQKQLKLIDVYFPASRRPGPDLGKFLPPRGAIMEGTTCYALAEKGCIVPGAAFEDLMAKTNNNPCSKCARWDSVGPACKAFVYHTAFGKYIAERDAKLAETRTAITPHNALEGPLSAMSIADIAKQYNLSKSVVRTIKQANHGLLTVEALTKHKEVTV